MASASCPGDQPPTPTALLHLKASSELDIDEEEVLGVLAAVAPIVGILGGFGTGATIAVESPIPPWEAISSSNARIRCGPGVHPFWATTGRRPRRRFVGPTDHSGIPPKGGLI